MTARSEEKLNGESRRPREGFIYLAYQSRFLFLHVLSSDLLRSTAVTLSCQLTWEILPPFPSNR